MTMTINLVINLLIILCILYADARLDSQKIKDGKTIQHGWEAFIVILICCLLMGFNALFSWTLFVAWLAQFLSMRFLMFDRILNNMMGWDKEFLGSTSKIDVFMKKMKGWGFDKIARVGLVMITSFFVIGELTAVFLDAKQENLLAWLIFISIAIVGIGVTIKNFLIKDSI